MFLLLVIELYTVVCVLCGVEGKTSYATATTFG